MTFAEQMLEKYEELLLANAGLKQVSVDGQTVSYAELERRYEFWRRRVAVERGSRPRSASIKLSSGFSA